MMSIKLVAFEAGKQLKWIALTFKKLPRVHIHVDLLKKGEYRRKYN
jgi:hypothetical protein